MSVRRTWVSCAAVVVALSFAGCGDDGGSDSIPVQEKLIVFQARGDVGVFCGAYKTEPSQLFDHAFESMLKAVRDLSTIYREHPDAKVEIPIEKKTLTMEQIVQEQARALRKCGRDGRRQAGVLEAALQQQQS